MKAETTTVYLPATAFYTGVDKDIEFESTLADYLPNINRIIRADAEVFCEDVNISNGKAELSGKAVFSLLYESDFKNKLHCERFSTDFTHRFELKDLPDAELFPTASAKCSYVGCKTLNPRRFMLRCRADISLDIKCMMPVQTVSMKDVLGAHFKSEKHTVAVYNPTIVRDYNMEESVPLDGMPSVGDIIYASVDISAGEITTADGSAVIRAEAAFKCLYEKEDDGDLQLATRRFPVVLTVDDDAIRADSHISYCLTAKGAETEKDIDAYGENRVVRLNYSVRAELNCINKQEVEVPTDMFFEEYDNENKLSAAPYEQTDKEQKHLFTVEKVLEIPEMLLERLVDLNVDLSVTDTALGDDGVSVKGSCFINVFGQTADGYRAHDCNIAFSELLPFSGDKGSRYKVSAVAQNPTADVSGGRLSVRVPVLLCLTATHKESISVLSSAEIEKREDTENGERPIIIYYPQKGESAWEIGRRYHVNPAIIVENNADAFDKDAVIAANGVVLYM